MQKELSLCADAAIGVGELDSEWDEEGGFRRRGEKMEGKQWSIGFPVSY